MRRKCYKMLRRNHLIRPVSPRRVFLFNASFLIPPPALSAYRKPRLITTTATSRRRRYLVHVSFIYTPRAGSFDDPCLERKKRVKNDVILGCIMPLQTFAACAHSTNYSCQLLFFERPSMCAAPLAAVRARASLELEFMGRGRIGACLPSASAISFRHRRRRADNFVKR